jgi:hypothetical protein
MLIFEVPDGGHTHRLVVPNRCEIASCTKSRKVDLPAARHFRGQMEQSLIDIAVESWRFSRLFGKVVSKLDAGESGRYVFANQLRYFQKKVEESLESSGLKLVNVEGQPYDPGMAASALNVGRLRP